MEKGHRAENILQKTQLHNTVLSTLPRRLHTHLHYSGVNITAFSFVDFLKIKSQDTFIYRSITHSYGFGMVSPRDFVYMLHLKTYDGNLMTTNSISVVYPNLPPTPAYIRGTTFSSGYACLPLPGKPEHTKLMMVVQVDLGGFLMPSVVDSVMPMSLINFVTDCKSGLKTLRQSET
uniref:StAR related lipid transfer domain containing 6 n=1 Tax=Naja naja TaxID=35670 RepID=A0A8C7E2E4_NAJNA